jgi:hypothetical protein
MLPLAIVYHTIRLQETAKEKRNYYQAAVRKWIFRTIGTSYQKDKNHLT